MHGTIQDSNPALKINGATRRVEVPATLRTIGVVGDRNSEQLTFEAPRFIEGHDVAGCTAVWVTWADAHGTTGKHVITSKKVTADKVGFAWTLSADATKAAGPLSFAVSFVDLDGEGVALYKWGTALCKELSIADTVKTRTGVDLLNDDETDLLQIDVNEAKLNADTYAAVRKVLYG